MSDKIAFCGVFLAAFGVVGTVCLPEIRHLTGLEPATPAPQSIPSAATPASAAPRPTADDLVITSLGDRSVITILPAKMPAAETASPVSQKGQNLKETYYLGPGKRASVSMTGRNDTLLLDPEVKSRVSVSTVGDDAKIKTLGAK